jgi:Tol biopolymer transport system component
MLYYPGFSKPMQSRMLILIAALALALPACAPDATSTPTLEPPPNATATLPSRAPAPPRTETPATGLPKVNSTVTPSASAAKGLSGEFAFAPGDGSIWIQDAASGQARPLVTVKPDAFSDAPEISPDGRTIVYSLSSLSAQGAAQNTIHVIGADGKNDRAVARPPDAKTELTSPAFAPDGQSVFFTASYPVPPSEQHFEIRRIPISGGATQTVISDAQTPAVSSDGKRLAFLRFDFHTFTAGLWLADSNGQNPKELVAKDLFAIIASPRFSPDGQWVLFSASGPPTRPLSSAQCQPYLLCAFAQPAYADGLPWALWLVSTDGAHFQQLTRNSYDSPTGAWSHDGAQIAFFDTGGIYLVDIKTHALSLVSKNGGHGVFDWWE